MYPHLAQGDRRSDCVGPSSWPFKRELVKRVENKLHFPFDRAKVQYEEKFVVVCPWGPGLGSPKCAAFCQ